MHGQRLKERRKLCGFSVEQLAQKMNTTRVTVSRWESGKHEPDDENKINLARLLGTSVAYLLGETDDPNPTLTAKIAISPKVTAMGPYSEKTREPAIESNVATINDALMIPVVSDDVSASCGHGTIYADDVRWEIVGYYPVDPNDLIGYTWQTDNFQVILAKGDSMEPRIHDGERVIFSSELKLQNADFAVVLWDRLTLIRAVLFNDDEGTITLRSMDEDRYKDIVVAQGDERFCVLGKVLGIAPAIRKMGTYY